MNRDAYSDQQAHASFQPRSPQPANEPSQFGQPVQHSSSTSDLGANWLNKASNWVADKFQTAQNFMGSGEAIAPDQILPALRGTASSPSQPAQSNQPLVGVIDSGFGANEHGSKMVEAIQQENPQAKIWQGGGVGTGGGLEALVEFVNVAKATGQRAVANLSFDLTEVHPDGSTSTRAQLTAEEQSALAYARDNGVLVVASSGNQGGAMSALGQASQPSDHLIVVGAANGSDRAAYSSYGEGLDLVTDVGAAGTSLAAAKVTGAIAKLWSANPELSSQQVNQILTATATDLKAPGRDAETGAGLLNAPGAIDLATHTAPEPIVFSGAQLIQQVRGSVGDMTWESRDGSIASERSTGFGSWLKKNAHGVLDVAGFIPVVGAVADVANAGLYAAEGDYANAALSAAAAVPGIGDAAAAAKLANRGVQAVRAANRGTRAPVPSQSRPSRPPSRPPTRPTSSGASGRPGAPSRPPQRQTVGGSNSRPPQRRTVGGSNSRPPQRQTVGGSNPRPPQRRTVGGSNSRPPQRQTVGGSNPRPPQRQTVGGSNPRPPQRRTVGGSNSRPPQRQTVGGSNPRPPQRQTVSGPNPRPPQRQTVGGSNSRPPQRQTVSGSNPRPSQSTGQATVRRGDTLWEIAQSRLGSGTRWRELRKPDGSSFTEQEARRLQPGESVRLPDTQPRRTETPTQSPWSPPPRKTPDPTPYIHTTGDRKYALDPVILSRLDEIRQGESLSEFAKRIRTRIWDNNGVELTNPNQAPMSGNPRRTPRSDLADSPRPTGSRTQPNQERPTDGGHSPSHSAPAPNAPSSGKPTSINASQLLPDHATREDVEMLQTILDRHPELSDIRSRATTPSGRRETLDWLKAIREDSGPSYNPYSTELDPNDPAISTISPSRSTEEMRRQPGTAEGGTNLPDTDRLLPLSEDATGRMPDQSAGNIGMIPGQIAHRMQGMHFDNFRQFRETFWKFVEQDPQLREGWSANNLNLMRQGRSPFTPGTEHVGGERVYQLDHSHDLQHGGGVYDLDSIRIVTPRFHDQYGN